MQANERFEINDSSSRIGQLLDQLALKNCEALQKRKLHWSSWVTFLFEFAEITALGFWSGFRRKIWN